MNNQYLFISGVIFNIYSPFSYISHTFSCQPIAFPVFDILPFVSFVSCPYRHIELFLVHIPLIERPSFD